ncbi:hypothetical protein EU642_21895 [Salmonella enterica]|nr:hypothetical protein [Salmonella enterica]EAO0118507.1 hypothetical protein [Salmonella enterica]EAO3601612.1 hypothetical protein [Salmonella enterica]EAR6391505.1 hypothetical protein [Salmonella enterica]EAV1285269.1 hypothetical protein [Salmonella enterica]
MPILFLKASGAPRKYANQPGYIKVKGHWVRANKDMKGTAGAPKAAHPEAHPKGKGYELPEEHAKQMLYAPEKAAKNHEMKNFNEKHVPGLLAHAKEGDVTAILGQKYGTNTHAKKLVAIANHLLEQMGSTHKVVLGQQAGEHEGVKTHPKAKGEAKPSEPEKAAEKPAEEADSQAVAEEAVEKVAEALQEPVAEKPAAPAESKILPMPAFMSGKKTKGVRTAYEQHAQKIIDAVEAKDINQLQALVNPNAGAWKGKTANSKMLLGMYGQALAALQKKGERFQPVAEEPNPVAAVETLASQPAQPKPAAKTKPDLAGIDWETYVTPANIKSAAGYNKQLDAVKAAAEAGDVYGILAQKYGTNTYAKKVAAAANMALTKLGHPHLKVVLGKTATHPLLDQIPQPSPEAQETMAVGAEVAAAKEEGPKNGDTRMGKTGMLVFQDGHWHKQGEDAPVDEKEANPRITTGSKVTPSQMPELPAGTIVACFNGEGKQTHQFMLGHSCAWFIPASGKMHKNPISAGKYKDLMGLGDMKPWDGVVSGYHSVEHPTQVVKKGPKGFMSPNMKNTIKWMFPGANATMPTGVYPILGGKMVAIADVTAKPVKGFAIDEKGDYFLLQNVTTGYSDPVYTQIMKGEDPGNNMAQELGLVGEELELPTNPGHSDPGISALLNSVEVNIDTEAYDQADHFIMLAAEAIAGEKGSAENVEAMKWLVAAKGKAHELAGQKKPDIPLAPAPEVPPAKMTPLPDFETPTEFHEWSKTEAAQKWLDEGELFYGGDAAFSESLEASNWDKWAASYDTEQEQAKEAAAAAKLAEEQKQPASPDMPEGSSWADVVHAVSKAVENKDLAAIQDQIDMTEGLHGAKAAEVNAWAKESKAWLLKHGGLGTDDGLIESIAAQGNIALQYKKAIEMCTYIQTPQAWAAAVNFFKDKGLVVMANKVATEEIMQNGAPDGLPPLPVFEDSNYKQLAAEAVGVVKHYNRSQSKTHLNMLMNDSQHYVGFDGLTVDAYLHELFTTLTGKTQAQSDAQGDAAAEALAAGDESKPTAEDQGPQEGDMKMGKGGMLILKNGHWVKAYPDDVPTPTYFGQHAGALTAMTNEIKAAFQEHGKDALKNGKVKIVNHKNGTYTVTVAGKKAPHVNPNGGGDFGAFGQFIAQAKATLGLGIAKGTTAKKTQANGQSAAQNPQAAQKSDESGKIEYDKLPDVAGWKVVGGQKGSNDGESLQDETGQRWYVKYPKDEQHAQVEVLAASIYEALGFKSQDAQLVMKNGKLGIASRWIDGLKQGSPEQLAAAPGALDGFLVDVWLGNRDVVGMSYDNLQIDSSGDAVRVDAGASFFFRAQGSKKEFGSIPTELESMLDPKVNHQTHSVFKGMTEADYMAAAAKLAAIPDAKIRIMVHAMGPGTKDDRKRLANTLIARKNKILEKYPVNAKGEPVKALDPTKLSVDPERLPKRHDFENWNGQGSGLSSKAHLNKYNNQVEQEMKDLAAKGDLIALKNFEFQPIDPNTGEPVGPKKPISEYPSKHVGYYHADLVAVLDELANPPVALKLFHEIDVDSIHELDAAFPTKPFGTTAASVAAQEKMGYWVGLGRAAKKSLEKLIPSKTMAYSQEAINKAYDRYKTAGKLAKAYINGIQASGSYNDLFRDGKEFDHNGNALKDVALAALDFATEQPAGTCLYRYQQMTPDMIKKFANAEDGTVFTAMGPMCTSYHPTATSHFGPNRIKIVYAEGAKAVESFGSGAFSSEKEVTTLPGQRFMIIKKEVKNGNLDMEILMLPPDLGL